MLLSDLAIGTKVADVNSKYNNKIIIWTVASKNHYGNNQVTLISDVLALKPSDAKEDGNSNSRNSYGNNRYSLSNIHSWLNSTKDNWYVATHSLDAPPSSSLVSTNPYDAEKGFCTNLSSKFLNRVKTTTITTAIPTCDGGGSENISCKFYLPSLMEVGLGQENGISEGSQFPLFTDNASRIIEFGGASREWELRTPASNNGYDFRHIRPNGTNYTNVANNGNMGIRVVCNIDSNIEVENKSSNYELKLSNYLSENASLTNALTVLSNKKDDIKVMKNNLYSILFEKGVECSEADKLGALVDKVGDIVSVNAPSYCESKNFYLHIKDLDRPLYKGNSEVVGDKIYYLCGNNSSATSYAGSTDILIFDTKTGNTSNITSTISPRVHAATCVHNDNIYILGGQNASWSAIQSTTQRYDTKLNTVSTMANITVARSDADCVVQGDDIYLFGGCNVQSGDYTPNAVSYKYSIPLNSWTTIQQTPITLYKHIARNLTEDTIFVGCGGKSNGSVSNKNAYSYSVSTNTYTTLESSSNYGYIEGCSTPNGVYCYGFSNTSYPSGCEFYNKNSSKWEFVPSPPHVTSNDYYANYLDGKIFLRTENYMYCYVL